MDDTITVYSNQNLRTLDRGNDLDTLDMPESETNDPFEYILNRKSFLEAYTNWNHDQNPLLQLRDELSGADVYLGKPTAQRIHEAVTKKQATVQLG